MHQLNAEVKEVFSGPHKIRKTAYRRVAVDTSVQPATGYAHVENGFYTGDVFITVDLEAIAWNLGKKAMSNKSHQSKEIGGLITVEVRNIRHEGGSEPQLRPEVKP